MPYSSTSRPAARVTSVNVPLRLLRYRCKRRSLPLVAGPVHAVDEQDVGPAVSVVVDERAAGSHRLGQQLAAKRPAVVAEPEPGRGRDIGEREADAFLREQIDGRRRRRDPRSDSAEELSP